MIKGNAHFMSPEHARGLPVDARSDVFSVGLVLYFCLTNQSLYSGANALEVLYKAACGPTEVELARIAALPPPAPAAAGRRPGGRSLAPLRDRRRLRQRPEPVRRRGEVPGGRAGAGAVRPGDCGRRWLSDTPPRRCPPRAGPAGHGPGAAAGGLRRSGPRGAHLGATTSSPSCAATAFTATAHDRCTRTPPAGTSTIARDPRLLGIGDFSGHLISGRDPAHFVAIRAFVDPDAGRRAPHAPAAGRAPDRSGSGGAGRLAGHRLSARHPAVQPGADHHLVARPRRACWSRTATRSRCWAS